MVNTPQTFGMYGFDAKLAGAKVIGQIQSVVERLEAKRSRPHALLAALPGIEAVAGTRASFIMAHPGRRRRA